MITLNVPKHEVKEGGKLVHLTFKEFCLAKLLLESKGYPVKREVIMKRVWNIKKADNLDTRTVDQHIARLRKKVKSEFIVTLSNVGYKCVSGSLIRA